MSDALANNNQGNALTMQNQSTKLNTITFLREFLDIIHHEFDFPLITCKHELFF